MATQLELYNAALWELGERELSALSDANEGRRVLDGVYSRVLAECLEAGQWNFAIRAVKLEADTGITPDFGPQHVFAKPSDFVRMVGCSADENFNSTVNDYLMEDTNIIANVDTLYVRYVSNSVDYGLDLTKWPTSFTRYVELALAQRVCERLTQNASKGEQLRRDLKDALRTAKSHDAMDDAQNRPRPMGSWNRGRSTNASERGSRTRLIG